MTAEQLQNIISMGEGYQAEFKKSDKIFFDEAPCPGFEIPGNVDKDMYDCFIAEAGITPATQLQQVFENLRLLDADNKIKNGAVLFFWS